MNSTVPNLFHYATKELAQDAALAYILAWADPVYHKTHSRLHELGTALLRALLATRIGETAIPTVTTLEVETQFKRIDLLALINVENEDGLVLLVEDKVDTDEHSNQIERYIETAKRRYPNRRIVPVYVKTGNVSRSYLPKSWGGFLRRDLLAVLNRFPHTGDTIVDNFRANLKDWEDQTNGYRDRGVDDWDGPQIEGFYVELENRMAKEDKWNGPCWGYAANRAGGVLWFAFAENTLAQEPLEVTMYLQIEDATRLTVRLSERRGPGIRSPLMYKVLERLEENARQTDDIKIKKAGRFKGGETAAVAEITFGDEDGYLALTHGDIVDMDATMRRLDRAREFVSKVASLYRG